jgi:hypothetical protein
MPDKVITATTEGECSCCSGIVAVGALECRLKGSLSGEASICGWSEYVSPSTPPKKYRRQTYVEDYNNCSYDRVDCPTDRAYGTTRDVVTSATHTFNALTCPAYVVAGDVRQFGGTVNSPGACAPWGGSLPNTQATAEQSLDMSGLPTLAGGFSYSTTTPTFIRVVGNASCANVGGPGSSHWYTGNKEWTLDIEDTESDGIDRFAADNTWSDWQAVGGGCANPGCCLAYYEERTSGFGFDFQSAQFRVTAGPLTPSTAYDVNVLIYRRAYGSSDPWVLYSTITISTTSDGSGYISVTGDVPNASGYESYADSATITLP